MAHQLKNKLNTPDILLGDYAELPALMITTGSMLVLPDPADTAYAHKMLTLCLDKQVETVYALQQKEYALLCEAGLLFNEYGITIDQFPR